MQRKASLQDQSKHNREAFFSSVHTNALSPKHLYSLPTIKIEHLAFFCPLLKTRTPSLIVCHPKAAAINQNLLHQPVLCFAICTPLLEPTQCGYESVPSPKPTYQHCLIEVQTSNTIILQTNKTHPIAKKEQQKLDFWHPQPFMMSNCLIVWHFLSIIHFFKVFTFYPSTNEKLDTISASQGFQQIEKIKFPWVSKC